MPPVDRRVLAAVVGCLDDRDAMVRAAAHDTLEHLAGSDARVRALLDGELPAPTRALAYGWLVRRLDEAAADLAVAAYERETDAQVRALLAEVAAAVPRAGTAVATTDPTVVAPHAPSPVAPVPHAPPAPRAAQALAPIAPIVRIEPIPAIEPAGVESRPTASRPGRPFGRAGFTVAPLAISGAYDLPVRSLQPARDAGVDLYFWEPGYDQLAGSRARTATRASSRARITPIRRRSRHDVERALRALRRDTLDAFLLFWTRSPARLDAAAYAALDQLRREGKLRAVGFSTHHRDLARAAIAARAPIDRPWDVVMIRHSAAHPGIETELLPAARAANTAIVTFSALTYGRMLAGAGAPTPAECYRYSLAQPGVTACITRRAGTPSSREPRALAEPSLPEARLAALRVHGAGVRAESAAVQHAAAPAHARSAAAAPELLAGEPIPDDALARRLRGTEDGRARVRTRLGTPRRR